MRKQKRNEVRQRLWYHNRAAHQHGAKEDLSVEDFAYLLEHRCCGHGIIRIYFIKPLERGGTNTRDNVELKCCRGCNKLNPDAKPFVSEFAPVKTEALAYLDHFLEE